MASNSSENKVGRVILVIVGILVLAAMGYFATRYFSTRQLAKAQQVTIDNLRDDITKLEADIIDLQTRIQDKNASLEEEDALIAERDARIEELDRKLRQAQASGKLKDKEISEIQNRLSLVQNQLRDYEEKIGRLENRILRQVDTIAVQRSTVARQESSLQNLQDLTREQADRLEEAGILQAADFSFFRVKRSGKEVEDEAFRRGSLEVIKVCFELLPNAEAQQGLRPITLRMLNEQGETLEEVKAQADYRNIGQRVCIPYSFPEKPEKGNYLAVILDEEGHELGNSVFEVK